MEHTQEQLEKGVLRRFLWVAEAQQELAIIKVGVSLHYVPQNRSSADGHHRLGSAFRFLTEADAFPPAEYDDFHRED